MDIAKVLEQLRFELESLNEAIASLERLQHVKPRRGRPISTSKSAVTRRREDSPAPQRGARKEKSSR